MHGLDLSAVRSTAPISPVRVLYGVLGLGIVGLLAGVVYASIYNVVANLGRCREKAALWRPPCSTVARLSASLWRSVRHRAALPSREWLRISGRF
ncbi:DUF5676 family membrane protein [Mesorhizobium sp. C420B]|uniref:DUF5676 family membrane protein n=1 Tax=unclassified Mesorhizobium TaxID=325217 RepID=UPI001FD9B04A|nr:DUF5676 family membrane protein [Mesorhizobium sp. LSHC420B00]